MLPLWDDYRPQIHVSPLLLPQMINHQAADACKKTSKELWVMSWSCLVNDITQGSLVPNTSLPGIHHVACSLVSEGRQDALYPPFFGQPCCMPLKTVFQWEPHLAFFLLFFEKVKLYCSKTLHVTFMYLSSMLFKHFIHFQCKSLSFIENISPHRTVFFPPKKILLR